MKILFLQKRCLFPPTTGGQIRTLNVLRHLARWHDVTYLCNWLPGDHAYRGEMEGLGVRLETIPWREAPRGSFGFYAGLAANLFSRFPFNVNKDFDPRLHRRAKQLIAENDFDLVVCDFVQMARNAIDLAGPPKLLFQHNVEAQIFERHTRQAASIARREYMRLQWKKMQRFEGMAGRKFDAVIAVSPQDAERFANDYGWDHVKVIDTAVDTDYFSPRPDAPRTNNVVFVGSLDWLPNEDGVRHFVREIWPAIRARHPEAVFQAVGRNPSPALQTLSREEGVEIVGTVPDVRPYLAEAAVVVVPLLVGGGTRMKIYEAMAMRRPVVSTTLGAEGLDVKPGRHMILADTPAEFARATVSVLEDPETAERLATAGYERVTNRFSAQSVARQFESICLDTASATCESRLARPEQARVCRQPSQPVARTS
ncbi:Glycosyl transferases group 1 [Maioricimonas rarisocia]|uniref:Glycosyl transferases group 1 n=1 Tax=Maioricimonas rarisocia TaxID=2528026 RepID=A0A517Z0R5_9PLAN|nr:glycosyltransferase [Maioricimonas rarisocia]QDU36071.1 Glycosyl transferases group 1 [Maioricimonas rarisocia]